jgi:hypothetical protein
MLGGNVAKAEHRVVQSMVSMTDLDMLDDQGRSHPVPRGAWILGVQADNPDVLRQARAGSLSFQPMLAPDAGAAAHIVTPRTTRKQEGSPMTTSFYEEIRKGAVETQRPSESLAQAIRRYEGEHPEIYRRFRESLDSTPVQKSAAETSALSRVGAAVAKEMARDPDLSKGDALLRVTEGREGRKLLDEYRAGREATIKATTNAPVDIERAKTDASWRLKNAITRTMREQQVSEAEATSRVLKTCKKSESVACQRINSNAKSPITSAE